MLGFDGWLVQKPSVKFLKSDQKPRWTVHDSSPVKKCKTNERLHWRAGIKETAPLVNKSKSYRLVGLDKWLVVQKPALNKCKCIYFEIILDYDEN